MLILSLFAWGRSLKTKNMDMRVTASLKSRVVLSKKKKKKEEVPQVFEYLPSFLSSCSLSAMQTSLFQWRLMGLFIR